MSFTPNLLSAAQAYGRRGWQVLPLHSPVDGRCSCGKSACRSPGKHPRSEHGLKDASNDSGQITRWWRRWPTANIGLATGIAFDVIDLDGPEALANVIEAQAGREMTPGPEVKTARGWHLYHLPSGLGNRARVLPGVDYRGKGGLVVAPPSAHVSGHVYEWVTYNGPEGVIEGDNEPLTEMPAWLITMIDTRSRAERPTAPVGGSPYGQRALEVEVGRVLLTPVGRRNDALNRAAFALGQLVAGGVLGAEAVAASLFEAGVRAGLTEPEAIATIRSGLRTGAQSPRGVPA